ncbi:MAG: Fe-S oxidoreductase, partial [Candidatus Collierbacteria bacterium GW2011_GWC2_43_12]
FCVWDHTINPIGSYRRFTAQRLFDEVRHVVDKYHVKEIFDDAGTFMIGKPLMDFCNMMIESGYAKKVVFGCNMRLNALKQEHYDLMGKANFRFILYGMESANQYTLDHLDKGLKVEQIEEGVRMAKKGGLDPHLTIMMGYPWESYQDAKNTVELAKKCFKKGYVDTLQATVVIPYPGTPLWKECKKEGWLLSEDYEDYDMRKPVMKSSLTETQVLELTQDLYKAALSPQFIYRKIIEIRNFNDIKFLFFSAWKFFGFLANFSPKQLNVDEAKAC